MSVITEWYEENGLGGTIYWIFMGDLPVLRDIVELRS